MKFEKKFLFRHCKNMLCHYFADNELLDKKYHFRHLRINPIGFYVQITNLQTLSNTTFKQLVLSGSVSTMSLYFHCNQKS